MSIFVMLRIDYFHTSQSQSSSPMSINVDQYCELSQKRSPPDARILNSKFPFQNNFRVPSIYSLHNCRYFLLAKGTLKVCPTKTLNRSLQSQLRSPSNPSLLRPEQCLLDSKRESKKKKQFLAHHRYKCQWTYETFRFVRLFKILA